MSINFISSKDSDETHNMHTKNDNIEIIMGSDTNDIIEELRKSLLQNYHNNLEESMKGSEFVLSGIDLLYYHLQIISLNRKETYIDSPKWLKNKKATINPKNNDNNCFQYALTVALTMRKKCPNTELFPDRIFLYLDWIRTHTAYLSVFSPNTGKYRPEIIPYLDNFHAVLNYQNIKRPSKNIEN